jgi:serine/threonine protein phosphatase 1
MLSEPVCARKPEFRAQQYAITLSEIAFVTLVVTQPMTRMPSTFPGSKAGRCWTSAGLVARVARAQRHPGPTVDSCVATLAIGDLHGHVGALRDLLAQVEPELTRDDELVFLGDYIDRGPDSKACIDEILALCERSAAAVTCLMGNHEEWLLRTMRDHHKHSWLLGMEALPTVRSYSEDAERILVEAMGDRGLALYMEQASLPYDVFFDAMPESHRRFFESLRLVHVTADAVCVHAGIDPDVAAIEDQFPRTFLWGAGAFPEGYAGERPVVYGHFNNAVFDDSGWPHPRITGKTVGIDTIAHGVLTAVRLPEGRVFQSRRTS